MQKRVDLAVDILLNLDPLHLSIFFFQVDRRLIDKGLLVGIV